MSVRHLDALFRPRTVAVIRGPGAETARAEAALANLREGGFAGEILEVTAQTPSLLGFGLAVELGELPTVPDLALINASAEDTPGIVQQLGARGCRAAVLLAPWPPADSPRGRHLREAVRAAARPTLLRLLGPGSGGLAVPAAGLNASLAHLNPRPGRVALLTQSAAVAAAVLDRAQARSIGFSCVVHVGESLDVDLADTLDWLAGDEDTAAVLMHFEAVSAGAKFLSAMRAVARNKPLVAIRCGQENADDAPLDSDAVYDAVLRRAGAVRLSTLEGMFDAAEAMARLRPLAGERLAILANGRGLAHLAADALHHGGGELAPAGNTGNPLILPSDASPAAWANALQALLTDSAVSAVLTVHAPNRFAHGTAVATALGAVAAASECNVLSCWVGEASASEARRIAAASGLLAYAVPEEAIKVFLGVVDYQRNRRLLLETPPSRSEDFTPDEAAARAAVTKSLAAGHARMAPSPSAQLLAAYGITSTGASATPGAATARIEIVDDAVFGPLLTLARPERAPSVALPPLNRTLACELVARAGLSATAPALCVLLQRLSQLLIDIDEIVGAELEWSDAGVHSASIRLARSERRRGVRRFAIRPYPHELEHALCWDGREILIRPIRPEDEELFAELVSAVSAEDRRLRFFHALRELPRADLARLTQIDYDREMALLAVALDAEGRPQALGEARLVADPDNGQAEFAVIVRSELKGRGLGQLLLRELIDYSRQRGTGALRGETLPENTPMQHLARRLGFALRSLLDKGTVELHLPLTRRH